MAGEKRSFEKLSEIEDPQSSVDVHVAVQQVTPIKKAKSGVAYFDGYVSDGSKQMRLVGFDEKLQSQLASFVDTKSPAKVVKCQIKRGRNQEFEIVLHNSSRIMASPRQLDFTGFDASSASPVPVNTITKDIPLSKLETMDEGDVVNTSGTVSAIKPARPVSTGLVQEVVLTNDENSTQVSMSVWDDNIDILEEWQTYEFKNLAVRSFRNKNTLMMTRQTVYVRTNEAAKPKTIKKENLLTITNINIAGVKDVAVQYACIQCSTKLAEIQKLSKCPSCRVVQVLDSCSYKATANI